MRGRIGEIRRKKRIADTFPANLRSKFTASKTTMKRPVIASGRSEKHAVYF
jgi:hypothetical protein